MNDLHLNLLGGWTAGYHFAMMKNKEDEVKQGKNYYLGAAYQVGQIGQLGIVLSKLSEFCTQRIFRLPLQITAQLGPLLALPATLFFAAVKDGKNEPLAQIGNAMWDRNKILSRIPLRLPESLGVRSTKVINFLAEHTGNMARVAMIVGSVALIVLGNIVFGGAVLSAVAYEAIDNLGYVPRKISLFVEKYMPIVAHVGTILTGIWVMRVLSTLMLSTELSPRVNKYIQNKVDLFVQKKMGISGPSVQEVDTPVVVNKNMKFSEITAILDQPCYEFEINPAHASKFVQGLDKFPENRNLDLFLTHFDSIDWIANPNLLISKLMEDDVFIDHLQMKFPEEPIKEVKANPSYYFGKAAANEDLTNEQYALNWVRGNMETLVKVLTGKKRVKGSQQDLQAGIDNLSKVLAHLESIKDSSRVEFEDILLQLSVEGGNYCARAIKRVGDGLMNNLLQNGRPAELSDDPTANYELKLGRALQDLRQEKVQQMFTTIVAQIASKCPIPESVKQDVHTYDIYRRMLSLGMYPLAEYERNQITLPEIAIWKAGYHREREMMYWSYYQSLDSAIKDVGNIHFANYVRQVINSNTELTEEQKNLLLDQYLDLPVPYSDPQYYPQKKFERLMLTMLGVIRLTKNPATGN